jgi:hydantoinase/carbamoylase family amidase
MEIDGISAFNATAGNGYTRFSYSEADRQAREYLIRKFNELGLSIRVDGVGNIRARLDGTRRGARVVMTGSHIDTVRNGGKFDGVVGVVCALEVVRSIVEEGRRLTHPIEIVVFAEEEGSNFMATMAGSKAMTGKYCVQDLKELVNEDGTSMYQTVKRFGLDPDRLEDEVIRPGEIKAMIEVHIEQGAMLAEEKVPIGIVEAIAGIKTFSIELEGVSNHAGTTPMHLRKNPMTAAARIISELDDIIKEMGTPKTVGTVGKILCEPNVPNIIPGKVSFTIDLRDVVPVGINAVETRLRERIQEEATRGRLGSTITVVSATEPISLDEVIVAAIERVAIRKGVAYRRMQSGAVHDSSVLAGITKVGMIFVPSINGRSHAPEEQTDIKDILVACDVLCGVINELAG